MTLPGPGVEIGLLTGAGFTGFGVKGVGTDTGLAGGAAGFKGAGVWVCCVCGTCGFGGIGVDGFWFTGCGGTAGFAVIGIGAGAVGLLGVAAPPLSMLMKARLAFLSSGV